MKDLIHILVLDDDKEELELIAEKFDGNGIKGYKTFYSREEFEKNLASAYIAIIDHSLNGATKGFNIVEKICEHNKERTSIAKMQVIMMSGTRNHSIPIYYINNRLARFWADKNEPTFYDDLVSYTKIVIAEIGFDLVIDTSLKEQEEMVNLLKNKVKEWHNEQ
jgi:CheY-like chemotaxis protein